MVNFMVHLGLTFANSQYALPLCISGALREPVGWGPCLIYHLCSPSAQDCLVGKTDSYVC